jgi:hypothetical protein
MHESVSKQLPRVKIRPIGVQRPERKVVFEISAQHPLRQEHERIGCEQHQDNVGNAAQPGWPAKPIRILVQGFVFPAGGCLIEESTTNRRVVCSYQPPPPPPPPPPPEKPPPLLPDEDPGGVTDELIAELRPLERPAVVALISKLFQEPLYQTG